VIGGKILAMHKRHGHTSAARLGLDTARHELVRRGRWRNGSLAKRLGCPAAEIKLEHALIEGRAPLEAHPARVRVHIGSCEMAREIECK
jgi:hypothetical protein